MAWNFLFLCPCQVLIWCLLPLFQYLVCIWTLLFFFIIYIYLLIKPSGPGIVLLEVFKYRLIIFNEEILRFSISSYVNFSIFSKFSNLMHKVTQKILILIGSVVMSHFLFFKLCVTSFLFLYQSCHSCINLLVFRKYQLWTSLILCFGSVYSISSSSYHYDFPFTLGFICCYFSNFFKWLCSFTFSLLHVYI